MRGLLLHLPRSTKFAQLATARLRRRLPGPTDRQAIQPSNQLFSNKTIPVMSKGGLPTSNASWDEQTIIGKRTTSGTKTFKTEAELNAARRSGVNITTEKKSSNEGQKLAKIEREAEEGIFQQEKVGLSLAKTIQQARQAKELTQKELATKINEASSIVSDYESGKGVPNQQVLAKMERILGIKLRGKDIGTPLPAPGSKKK
jgi:putative transcription factor